jgi:hypothetical protein
MNVSRFMLQVPCCVFLHSPTATWRLRTGDLFRGARRQVLNVSGSTQLKQKAGLYAPLTVFNSIFQKSIKIEQIPSFHKSNMCDISSIRHDLRHSFR